MTVRHRLARAVLLAVVARPPLSRRAGAQGAIAGAAGRRRALRGRLRGRQAWRPVALDAARRARSPIAHSQSLRGWITETDQVDDASTPTECRSSIDDPRRHAERRCRRDLRDRRRRQGDLEEPRSTAARSPAGAGYLSCQPAAPFLANDARSIALLAAAGARGLDLLPERPRARSRPDRPRRSRARTGPKTVQLAFAARASAPSPPPVWLDEQGKLFRRRRLDLGLMPGGLRGQCQADARPRRTRRPPPLVRPSPSGFLTAEAQAPVLFDNVRLFDADKGVFVENQAVLAGDGKIASDRRRAGSMLRRRTSGSIDGTGKTLVPGIWDSHMHIGDDWDVLPTWPTA